MIDDSDRRTKETYHTHIRGPAHERNMETIFEKRFIYSFVPVTDIYIFAIIGIIAGLVAGFRIVSDCQS